MNFIKKHSKLLISLFANIFFLAFIVLLCGTSYELSDDWFFAENIANGYYDYTFCNYFIQVLSGVIQQVIYPVNAFMLLQMVFGFVAMTTIGYIFLDTFDFKKGLLYLLIIEGLFAVNIYSLVTFTKTAAILITAGGLMMLWSYHNKKHLGYWFYGIALVILGSFYRFKIFYSILAVFFFFICGLLLNRLEKFNIKSILALAKEVLTVKTVSIVLAMIILVFSFNIVSREIIYSDESMEFYKEYNSLRSSVVDYAMPNFNDPDVIKKFAEIGISANDIEMMRLWYLDDQGYADIETLTKICEIQNAEGQVWYKSVVNIFVVRVMEIFRFSPEGILILAFLILAIVTLLLHKIKIIIPVGSLVLAIGTLYSYLAITGRCNYRAAFSIWFAATACLLYLNRYTEFKEKTGKKSTSYNAVIIAFMVVFSIVFMLVTMKVTVPELAQREDEDYVQLQEYINSSKDKTFALSRFAYLSVRNATKMDNILLLQENEAFDKCVYFGTPYYGHPRYNELLSNKGIENLYTDIIDNENLYFVEMEFETGISNVDVFTTYLNEQYGRDNIIYKYELVDAVEQFSIYRIITEN